MEKYSTDSPNSYSFHSGSSDNKNPNNYSYLIKTGRQVVKANYLSQEEM